MAIPVISRATYLQCAFKFGLWSGDTAPTQFYDVVNFTKLEITGVKQETDDLVSNMEGTFGETLASVSKPTEAASLAAEADYMPPVLFGLLIGADMTELAQTGATINDDPITAAVGLWAPLAHKYITPHGTGTEIVAKTAADATVDSTHYTIDTVNGLFKALDATGATVTKVSYKTSTRTGEIYKGGKAKSSYVMLVGSATEKVSQKRGRMVIHKANLAANAAFDAVAGGYIKGAFAGKLLTPTGETSPFTWTYTDLASTL